MTRELNELTKQIRPVLEKHHIKKAAIFGSFARGDNNQESDVDILVEPPAKMSLLAFVRLERELKNTIGKEVDLVTFRSLSPLLRPYVEKNLVAI